MRRNTVHLDLPDGRSPLVPTDILVGMGAPQIENDYIVWKSTGKVSQLRNQSAKDLKLVQDFASLVGGDEKRLLGFAQKYGPLLLCKHGFALGHRSPVNERCCESYSTPEAITRGEFAREPVWAWLRYARRARGVHDVAAKLRDDRRASNADWAWLLDGIPADYYESPLDALLAMRKEDPLAANPLIVVLAAQPRTSLAEQKATLALVVNHWLDECEAGVSIDWSKSGVDFRIGRSDPLGRGNSVLIAIGVQLLRAVLRHESFVWCSVCGWPYEPKRWPRAGENHYCRECGRSAAIRIAQRKFREKRAHRKGEPE